MTQVYGQNFYDQQRASRYPFTDTSTLVTDTGYTLGTDVFLDAVIYPVGAGPRLALTSIVVTTDSVTLWIGDGNTEQMASAVVNPLLPVNAYVFLDSVGRVAGQLVADPIPLAALSTWAAGTHTFAQGEADFVARCTIPIPATGLLGLTDGKTVISGDTWFVGEDGVTLVGDADTGLITINVVGDPLFKRRNCAGAGSNAFITPSYLCTINHTGPDVFGNFTIAANPIVAPGTILRVNPKGAHGLELSISGQVMPKA